MTIHTVLPGETVYSIAELYGVSTAGIEATNQLQYPYSLVIGQALLIDTGEPRGVQTPLYVNGYAYPFISQWVLDRTLPDLSYLSVFSYGFTAEGNLVYPQLDDAFMIDSAIRTQTSPVLTLTPFDESGNFNNNLINALVRDEVASDNLIAQLIAIMQEKGFVALDIDFEFILAEDRDLFTSFVAKVKERLTPYGYQVYVALAPKTSADQQGLLYQGKDYGGLGAVADAVLLMTYEWGYKYGPPLAVAPIPSVRRVLDYAITEIPVSKINLGIPNYGYDWPLPYVRGTTAATTIGNIEAVRIAQENNAQILYDEQSQAPYFYYYKDGVEHVVWFEDVRSMQAKFDLIREYGLRGAGYWTVMQWFQANWELLASEFTIIKPGV